MPRGVEHRIARVLKVRMLSLHLYVMPRGVEHVVVGVKSSPKLCWLHLYVMPRGVEHLLPVECWHLALNVALVCDAERR